MPTILVVDDNPLDRTLVGGLLERVEGWRVRYAVDAAAAQQDVQHVRPDVVVTDLVLPDVDGLSLIRQLRAGRPPTPVVLITSRGSEELAVQALQAGAASYIPKTALAYELVDTLHTVLSLAVDLRTHARLLDSATLSESWFCLENDSALLPPLLAYLQQDAERIGAFDAAERLRIGVALDEALVNALFHGNLEIESGLRDADHEAYQALVERRRREPPYAGRKLHVYSRLTPREARFVIRDEGPGFDPAMLPDPTDPLNLDRIGGRGVMLIRTFMDEVCYSPSGNELTLVKRVGAKP